QYTELPSDVKILSAADRGAANPPAEASFDEGVVARTVSHVQKPGYSQPRVAGESSIVDMSSTKHSTDITLIESQDAAESSYGPCDVNDPRLTEKVASSTMWLGRPSDLKRRLSGTEMTPTTKRQNIARFEVQFKQNASEVGSNAISTPRLDHGLCSAISEDSVSTQSIDKSHVLSPSITITDAVISGLSELNTYEDRRFLPLHQDTESLREASDARMDPAEYFQDNDYLPPEEPFSAWKPQNISGSSSIHIMGSSFRARISGLYGISVFTGSTDKNSVTSQEWQDHLKKPSNRLIESIKKDPLIYAIENDKVSRVMVFLRNASAGDINKVIKALRSKGGDIVSALNAAIESHDTQWVDHILRFVPADDLNALHNHDCNALQLVIKHCNCAIIRALVSKGGMFSTLKAAVKTDNMTRLRAILPFVLPEHLNDSGQGDTKSV
ncbi:hypothetical protein LTS18_012829, partial [Coniosporium uncinatum]